MNRKEHLYAIIGGCVGTILTLVVCSFLPVGAQSGGSNFGKITCTGLEVISLEGRTVVEMGSGKTGGFIVCKPNTPKNSTGVYMNAGRYGGEMICFQHINADTGAEESVKIGFESGASAEITINDGLVSPLVELSTNERGGTIEVISRESYEMDLTKITVDDLLRDPVEDGGVRVSVGDHGGAVVGFSRGEASGSVMLTSDNDGGLVLVNGKGTDPNRVILSASENSGSIVVFGADKDNAAIMTTDAHGGTFTVYGKGQSNTRAILGVNEYGNGVINTWDKNGYRLKP